MDFLEIKDWIVIVSKITSMEKETGGNINVKVPYKQTTVEDEEFKLAEIRTKLDEIQGIYNIQENFVNQIKAL